ncbi:hypothetical protein NDU88_005487 [Pleurodeles waltl]|uniref:Uncharacterized protein n=1 Tax=Pleurodeles waltl TaxID=8319 RepID=A0AAV7QG38_PLEWA|nr:hypothetical protein NDU88_005487 [Pleurodeles waltl]
MEYISHGGMTFYVLLESCLPETPPVAFPGCVSIGTTTGPALRASLCQGRSSLAPPLRKTKCVSGLGHKETATAHEEYRNTAPTLQFVQADAATSLTGADTKLQ